LNINNIHYCLFDYKKKESILSVLLKGYEKDGLYEIEVEKVDMVEEINLKMNVLRF
jgi:hypothetical protein